MKKIFKKRIHKTEHGCDLTEMNLVPVQKVQIWKLLFCWEETDDSGVGVVEVILILVVLIALVILFRDQLTDLVEKLLRNISRNALNL